MNLPNLAELNIYPVKSLRGHPVAACLVERPGLENDRRFMIVDPAGRFVTQREYARMALITPSSQADTLALSAPGMEEISLEVKRSGKHMNVEIWSSPAVDSIDQGDMPAAWLSDFLKMPVRLVRMADHFQRTLDPKYALQADDHVSFADGYPILIVSQESLDDLNSRMSQPVPMNRFRPNLVVQGVAPHAPAGFAEDGWKRIRIGQVEMALVKPCARCNVPAINQDTAEIGREPNTTLATFRKRDGKVFFGVNVIPITTGKLQIGDSLEILE